MGAGLGLVAWHLTCPLVQVSGSLRYFADVSNIGQDTARCSAFCPLYCFACGGLLANVALFRVFRAFLEGFMGFVWVCVVLALCVDCVALYA